MNNYNIIFCIFCIKIFLNRIMLKRKNKWKETKIVKAQKIKNTGNKCKVSILVSTKTQILLFNKIFLVQILKKTIL